jgi:GxxExxY protein
MMMELKRRGQVVAMQNSFPAFYHGELIGNLVPDLIVDNAVIVDPKVVACFTETHVAQMIGYLNITGLDLANLINFKNARLEWKRVLCVRKSARKNSSLIYMSSFSYPCYPCNPWLIA